MGKRKTKELYKRYLKNKRKTQEIRLPGLLKKALIEEGVDVPKKFKNANSFYRSLGLRKDMNSDAAHMIGYHDKLGDIRRGRIAEEAPRENTAGDLFEKANEKIPHGTGYKKHLTDFEIKCLCQLRAFYGDDLQMMVYDYRRNPMQWSLGQLRDKMATYERTAQLLSTKAAELEADDSGDEDSDDAPFVCVEEEEEEEAEEETQK